jgi:hypothetical protein
MTGERASDLLQIGRCFTDSSANNLAPEQGASQTTKVQKLDCLVKDRPVLPGDSPLRLLFDHSTPGGGAKPHHAGEYSRQVALIGKAASQRHLRHRHSAITQFLLSHLDAMLEEPRVRRYSYAAPKRARKIAQR